MQKPAKTLQAAFYVTEAGNRPVREWLMELTAADRKVVGEDIATLEFCCPKAGVMRSAGDATGL